MDTIKATPRNDLIGRLADILTSGKTTANKYQILPQVPLIGGTGLGDLFLGKAPELVDDISYDGLRAAIRGGNVATGGVGTYGARPAVADAALLGMDVAGLGKGLGGLSKKSASALYDKLMEGGVTLSRREALKKLGAISGSAALAGTGVGALRKLSDNAISEVVHTAPKVADNIAATVAKNYKFNTLADYLSYVKGLGKDTTNEMFSELDILHNNAKAGISGYEPQWFSKSARETDYKSSLGEEIKNILKQDEEFYNTHKANVAVGKEPTPWSIEVDPHTGKYTSIYADEVFSPQAKQEMKDFKNKLRMADRDGFLGEESMMNDPYDMAEIAREFDTYSKQHSAFDTQYINPVEYYDNTYLNTGELPF